MKRKIFVFILLLISFITMKSVYAETYNGEYSIEYLLKNYNVVTFAQNNYGNNQGTISNTNSIEGAILVEGNYTSTQPAVFGTNTGGIKSFIKGTRGNNVTTTSELISDANYLDFERLFTQVMIESITLADKTEYYINSAKLEINKPGIYTIQNTADFTIGVNSNPYYTRDARNNVLLIKNYDRNGLYVFNYYNEYVQYLPNIKIIENGSSNAVSIENYIENGNYTGNIIWNFPNAKSVNNVYSYGLWGLDFVNNETPAIYGSIIAPKADVYLYRYNYGIENKNYYGTIIANKLHSLRNIKSANYNNSSKLLNGEINQYYDKIIDYEDDYYTRDYSISDLLQNYSLITLGHKKIDSKSKILEYGNTPGSVRLFHITGQALISGDLCGKTYEDMMDDYLPYYAKYDRVTFDLESNKVTESYIRGNVLTPRNFMYSVIQPWDNMANDNYNYLYQKNNLFVGTSNSYNYYGHSGPGNFSLMMDNYINFDRLYDNVVAEQSGIEAGKTLTVDSDGILHIPTGGTYTIEDISNVREIVFDNFEKNKDELTIITIKNEGDINFPLVSKDDSSKAIITNDYFGKEQATHLYELNTFLSEDSYYGNIVWNLPNADYIKLKENAPFAGHMIAPNADVETPELHFAGCFIVNSIYGEGNTEAHFYPIRSDLKCVSREYDSLSENQKKKFNDYRLRKALGGDNTIIEKEILGDKAQYDKDIALFESLIGKCDNREIIINPKTASTIGILLAITAIAFTGLMIKTKKKNS
ncbi:MAG: choice-of-anchor A family protein [Bacilli bacterium]|nr:choice-of-anchor A family protein [Bacilli bacterium]